MPDPEGMPTLFRGLTYRGGEWEVRLALTDAPDAEPVILTLPRRPPTAEPPRLRLTGGWVIPP